MPTALTFGETIKSLREARGLTLAQVAGHIKMDVSLLSKVEKNKRNISQRMILKLSQLFKVGESDLRIAALSDRVAYEILVHDRLAERILQVAGEKVKYSLKSSRK